MKIPDGNPLQWELILDRGDTKHTSETSDQSEAQRLVTYVTEALSVRNDDLWVNFSAYEPDRVISPVLSQTSMGQGLLAQDILMKRLATSLVHPELEAGHEYWARVFEQVQRFCGSTVPMLDAFPKVWVVPERAVLEVKSYPNTTLDTPVLQWDKAGKGVFIVESQLAVKLEQDQVATAEHRNRYAPRHRVVREDMDKRLHDICLPLYKDLILALIAREVNEGAHFAQMRQICHAIFLGIWMKKNFSKEQILSRHIDSNNFPLTPHIQKIENSRNTECLQLEKWARNREHSGKPATLTYSPSLKQDTFIVGSEEIAFLAYAKRLGFMIALEENHSGGAHTVPRMKLARDSVITVVKPTDDGLKITVTGRESDHKSFEKVYQQLTSYDPLQSDITTEELVNVLVEQGVLLNNAGYHELALHCAERALALDPAHGRAWNAKGSSLASREQHREAIQCYQEAIRYNPQLMRARLNIGNRYRALNEMEKAKLAFEAAVATPMSRGEEECFRLDAYEQLGRLDEALAWGNKLLREPLAGIDREGIRQKLRMLESKKYLMRCAVSVRDEGEELPAPVMSNGQRIPYYSQYLELLRGGVYTCVHRQHVPDTKRPRLRLLVSGGMQLGVLTIGYLR